MSWSEIFKTINNNFDIPLNKQINATQNVVYTPSTAEARQALVDLGYTLRETFTSGDNNNLYVYSRNAGVPARTWQSAFDICTNWCNLINKWSTENGFGNICVFSRSTSGNDNLYSILQATPIEIGKTYAYHEFSSSGYFTYYKSSALNISNSTTSNPDMCIPMIYII